MLAGEYAKYRGKIYDSGENDNRALPLVGYFILHNEQDCIRSAETVGDAVVVV
jgi:hypothetical protein